MSTRAEQLAFCTQCTKRSFDPAKGVICSLTSEQATFDGTCPDYEKDETVKPKPLVSDEGTAGGSANEVVDLLSPEYKQQLKDQQNIVTGLIASLVVGLTTAILWATITIVTEYQIGWLAVGVGAAVGITMRFAGKGIDQVFGLIGGAVALFSVVLGNIFVIVGLVADMEGLTVFETLSLMNWSILPELMAETFSPIDILFYFLAIGAGYKYSFRTIDQIK